MECGYLKVMLSWIQLLVIFVFRARLFHAFVFIYSKLFPNIFFLCNHQSVSSLGPESFGRSRSYNDHYKKMFNVYTDSRLTIKGRLSIL